MKRDVEPIRNFIRSGSFHIIARKKVDSLISLKVVPINMQGIGERGGGRQRSGGRPWEVKDEQRKGKRGREK